jgi:predicted phage-related endonuclease
MSIEILTPASREEWLSLRKQTIGASEAAVLLGAHPWVTLAELWTAKSGRLPGLEDETPAMRRGRHLESVAVEFLREERPAWKVTANPIPGGKFYRDLDAGQSCTPDAFAVDPSREGFGVVQIKSVAPIAFKANWKSGDAEVEAPIYAIIQAIQEAAMTGASWACVAGLVVDHGIDLHLIGIPIHGPIIDRLRNEAKDFWRTVREGQPPTYDYERDGGLLARLYPDDNGETVDLSGINELPELAAEYADLARIVKAGEERRKAIKTRFLAEMKEAQIATFNGQVIATAKTTKVKAYEVKASQYRAVRIKTAA